MTDFRLMLGDCLDVLASLPDCSVNAVVTDPPYCSGGRQAQGARNQVSKNGRENADWFIGDNMGGDTYAWWMRHIARECLRVSTGGSHAHVFTDWRQYTATVMAWESVGWTLRGVLVWDKAKGGAMGSFWRNNHEFDCIFTKGQPRKLTHGGFFNTWTGTKPQGGHHPTEKPLGLMEYICSSIPAGSPILDPFMGSGTTGVAAVQTGHPFVGIERDPGYLEVASRRIAAAQAQLALTA